MAKATQAAGQGTRRSSPLGVHTLEALRADGAWQHPSSSLGTGDRETDVAGLTPGHSKAFVALFFLIQHTGCIQISSTEILLVVCVIFQVRDPIQDHLLCFWVSCLFSLPLSGAAFLHLSVLMLSLLKEVSTCFEKVDAHHYINSYFFSSGKFQSISEWVLGV